MSAPSSWPIVPALLVALLVAVLATSGCAAWRIGKASELAQRSEPLQQVPADPALRLLIVGDSTGVGTGASAPQASLAGQLAQAYPRLQIDNRARDGATFADVVGQLDAVTARYDLVLVQAGGNDVIRLRRLEDVRADVDRVVTLARARGERVVVMPAGNVGNAPFFFPPVSWLMTSRARSLHGFVREAAARHQAVYVNLFKDKADDPFAQRRELNAADGLHPSDAGYRVWFDELLAQGRLAPVLAPAKAR
ncbi:SGNH/GDSL hydrolase family protein [Hydrogenophaga laconesensis]|uniref:Lysophospholipase L1-like esterase n=1 Tax=Hydrogenophaga laconesensis TaxID=1805971 RepID=A0ABU1VD34_9BURK|nr:GDSL-type esterase/lipase family protein [Hydrogenophaga laconesensis]MDR7095362.1 lysophospholipase L1-like esterase [Hydrogenophaga laconesensis]